METEQETSDKIKEVADWASEEVERLKEEIETLPEEQRRERLDDIRNELQSEGMDTTQMSDSELIIEHVRKATEELGRGE